MDELEPLLVFAEKGDLEAVKAEVEKAQAQLVQLVG